VAKTLTSTHKVCISCKKEKLVTDFYQNGLLTNGSPKYNSWCKLCRLEKAKIRYDEGNEYGYVSIKSKRSKSPRNYLSYLLCKARQRNKEVKITLDYLEALWIEQNGKCALSGRQMSYKIGNRDVASIDRIDSSKGYIDGNVQLVGKYVNIAKSDMSMEDFYNMCKEVYFHGA
jgi:hypothetical protein